MKRMYFLFNHDQTHQLAHSLPIALLSLDGMTLMKEDTLNRLMEREYARILYSLVLNYNATSRINSDFWNHVRTMPVPGTLAEKVAIFKVNGQIFYEEDELFTEASWTEVMGQGIRMQGGNAMADALDPTKTRGEIDEMEKAIRDLVKVMPGHIDYLARKCPTPMAA